MKEYSSACVQNRDPILAIIGRVFTAPGRILEIGSGTGQHAVYFARHLPHLKWQTSDLPCNHASIAAWIRDSGLDNALYPLSLDVTRPDWRAQDIQGVFSANTAHIMHWPMVEQMFAGVGRILGPGASFCLYGPFNYGHAYTSKSNERFDAWLKERDPLSGIRNIEDLEQLAAGHGLALGEDNAMPANNRLLVWVKG